MRKSFILILIFILSATSVSFGSTKLVFTVHWSDYQLEGIKSKEGDVIVKGLKHYVEEYMKSHPDVEIEIRSVAFEELLKKIIIDHSAGLPSDIYVLYSLWGVELVRSGILDEPPKDIQNAVKLLFSKPAIDGATINGKVWGVPIEVDNYALVYNKKILVEAGFKKPPQKWTDLVNMAPKLTKKNPDGSISQYGFAFLAGWDSAVVHPYLALLYSNGGVFLSKDFKECLLDRKEAIEALEAELELFRRGATNTAASAFNFPNGTIAMMVMAPWYETSLKVGFKDKYQEIVGVAPIPYLKKPATCGYTWLIGVDSASKNKKQAWDFIRWMTIQTMPNGATRMGELMAKNIGAIPPRRSDLDKFPNELKDLYTQVFVKELIHTIQEPNVAQGQEIKTALMREIVEAWNGRKTAEQALKDAKKKIEDILRENY